MGREQERLRKQTILDEYGRWHDEVLRLWGLKNVDYRKWRRACVDAQNGWWKKRWASISRPDWAYWIERRACYQLGSFHGCPIFFFFGGERFTLLDMLLNKILLSLAFESRLVCLHVANHIAYGRDMLVPIGNNKLSKADGTQF